MKLPYTAKLTSGVISDRLLNHPAEWLPSYVQRGDFFTTYQLYLGPSVLNYIACEINVNTRSDFTKKWQNPQTENPMIGYVTPGGDGDPNSFGQGDVSLISPSINMDVVNDTSVTVTEEDLELVRKAHTNSGGLGWTYRRGFNLLGRDGGGEWDHKPKIEPHYGNYIRTGNSGNLYYYDYFSNIHFGYIAHAMGMSTERSLLGTNIFQQVDNAGASEDYYDKSPNLAGWRLAARKRANSTYPGNMVTSYDIYQELLSHPRWESMSRPGVRRIAGQQKQDWHLFE